MILQALCELYDRRSQLADPVERPAPIGFENKEIPFVIEITSDGDLVQISDTREVQGKKKIARAMQVPQAIKRTAGVTANLLWDTVEYALGIDSRGKADRVREQHSAFRARIEALPEAVQRDEGVTAVLRFLEKRDMTALEQQTDWDEIRTLNPNLTFRLQGDLELICQRQAVRDAWLKEFEASEADGICMVTGERSEIALTHPAIKGVWNAQSSGANLISFNLDAFCSYGKEQGFNAPVGKIAAVKYTTALNDLLGRGSQQRTQIGDASTVFWSEKQSDMEGDFSLLFGIMRPDDPAYDTDRVKNLYDSIRTGKYVAQHDAKTMFYVLGLSPNAARIAVRFWYAQTEQALAKRIDAHFKDIQVIRPSYIKYEFPRLDDLTKACKSPGSGDDVTRILGSDILRAVFEQTTYPYTWLESAVIRSRAEQDVSYERACALKACLIRLDKEHPYGPDLDESRADPPYRLGRLFATLEKLQDEAFEGRLNATIRDRHFGAAATAPATVFPTLLALATHHLPKLESLKSSRAEWLDRLIGEIVAGIDVSTVTALDMKDQARFFLGYYQQRQTFFLPAGLHKALKEHSANVDAGSTDTAWQLGRLFATLEAIQDRAHERKLSVALRELDYATAASRPALSFTTLLAQSQHHLRSLRLRDDHAVFFERWLTQIASTLKPDLPTQLRLEQQWRFAVGYYQQRPLLDAFKSAPLVRITLVKEHSDLAYRWGRWFAVAEKLQAKALTEDDPEHRINATLRDRYFAAAARNPASVYATLQRLSKAHLGKLWRLNEGAARFLRQLFESIGELPEKMPNRCSIAEQGRFAIGYYHQKQIFHLSRDDNDQGNNEKESA